MQEQTFYLIPQPKQVAPMDGAFVIDTQTEILLLPECDARTVTAAQILQGEIVAETGLRPPIVKAARPAREENIIVLADDLEALGRFLPEETIPPEEPRANQLRSHGPQAYFVSVRLGRIVAGGEGSEAAHYAAQTLRQLVRAGGSRLPALELLDWPSIPYRGVMLDVSRGKVPTLETLYQVVDQLSLLKANVLQLYTEHTFDFVHHPRIGQGCGPLSSDDMLRLDAYAHQRHVELQPNLQSFGHWAHILNLPEYAHLAEAEIRWSVSPADEGSYVLLDDLYADLLPSFHSRQFNVGCDETWDLGKGRTAARAQEVGVGRVYLEHILRLRELAARYGRRIQIWGDILLHHPELVAELPDDVILLDWHYEAEDDYPSVRLFGESGRTFWVCPGTSSWNTLFPRIENANGNIRTLARLGAEHGAEGLLNTDWGDHGHYQPLGQSWYGYAYGAEQAWTGGKTDDDAYDRALGRLFFGAGGDRVVEAIRALGRLNVLEGMPLPNATRSIYALLDEPLTGQVFEALPAHTLNELIEGSGAAEEAFLQALSLSREPLAQREMAFSARLMGYAARKVLASQQLRAMLAALGRGEGDSQQELSEGIATLRQLDQELAEHTEEFRNLWLARARHSEIEISLGHLVGVRERYARAIAWLQERLGALQTGEAPGYSLDDYAREAEDYMVLGQRFWQRWRELGLR